MISERLVIIKMTKQDCVNYCYNSIVQSWKQRPKATEYNARGEFYADCLRVCKENGYVDACFDDIWNRACKRYAIEKSCYRSN